MTGFWPLLRKEMLELRRTWRALSIFAIFALVAVVVPVIARIVIWVRDIGLTPGADMMEGIGITITVLGTFMAIILTMGALAQERASGTAAMTLSKPVTRGAFVAAKFVSMIVALGAALAGAWLVAFVAVTLLFEYPGFVAPVLGFAVIGGYLLYIGSTAFFFSSMMKAHLGAGGMAFGAYVLMQPLNAIPHTYRYLPTNTVDYAASVLNGHANNTWPALLIGLAASVVLLGLSSLIFRTKEL